MIQIKGKCQVRGLSGRAPAAPAAAGLLATTQMLSAVPEAHELAQPSPSQLSGCIRILQEDRSLLSSKLSACAAAADGRGDGSGGGAIADDDNQFRQAVGVTSVQVTNARARIRLGHVTSPSDVSAQ